jgi:iron complex outermembrane receptor protein
MSGRTPRAAAVSRVLFQALLLSTAPATLAFAQDATIETVVVTAQKRAQNVQDVPVSMTVLSGKSLEDFHQTDLHDAMNNIPNLFVLQSGVDDVVSIRGFGSGPNNIAFDQEVSIYQDGVYGGRSAQFMEPLFDVDRMEVLRGPQGASFGKNTAAGAISIISAGPTDTFEGAVTADYNFIEQGFDINGYVAGPITDDLGFRVAAKFVDEDGFIKNDATGNDDPHDSQQLVRATLKWAPTAQFDVTGKIEYGHEKVTGGFNVSAPLDVRVDPPDHRYAQNPYSPSGLPEENAITSVNGSLNANYRFGDFTVTSITGVSHFDTTRLSAYDQTLPTGGITAAAFANGFPEHFNQYSEELRLLSPTGEKLEYIVGAYVDSSNYDLGQFRDYNFGGGFAGFDETNYRQRAISYSVFAQATYHITDDFRALGSLRYSDNIKSGHFTSGVVAGIGLAPAYTSADGHINEQSVDPSVTLQYDARKDIMFYATYAQGSKSGGFVSNTYGTTDATFTFKPERSTNYEVGVKSTLLDGHLLFNATIFNMVFKNLQESAFDPTTQTFLTRNAAGATSRGLETTVTWLPVDNLEMTADFAYLDAKYDNFKGAACLALDPITVCNPNDPASVAEHNIAGLPLLYASKWTGNFKVHHTLPLDGGLQIDTTIVAALRTSYFASDDYDPFYGFQPSYWKLDTRIQLGTTDGTWDVAVVGKNLTNELSIGDALDFPLGVARGMQWIDQGRSVEIEGSYHF